MEWDPNIYLSFERTRLQLALDLIHRIPNRDYREIADLGCGPENVTEILKQQWPKANVTGFDSSRDMLEKAKSSFPHLNWVEKDAANFHCEKPIDVIFSNACLQWLPDHKTLMPNLLNQLNDGGVLAIQMPNNYRRPTHQLVEDAAHKSNNYKFLENLFNPIPVESPNFYYDILSPYSTHLEIWETDYLQTLEGENPVTDWTTGSYLRPFLQALKGQDRIQFEECYRELILDAYPKQKNGKTLLPFKRLFILAIK